MILEEALYLSIHLENEILSSYYPILELNQLTFPSLFLILSYLFL